MALNKAGLKADIKTMLVELKEAADQETAIEKFASDLSNALDKFVKSASVYATPLDVTSAAMSNSGGPVVASNNLNSKIE